MITLQASYPPHVKIFFAQGAPIAVPTVGLFARVVPETEPRSTISYRQSRRGVPPIPEATDYGPPEDVRLVRLRHVGGVAASCVGVRRCICAALHAARTVNAVVFFALTVQAVLSRRTHGALRGGKTVHGWT